MRKGLVNLGFTVFILEFVSLIIYGLTLVNWNAFTSLLTDKVLILIFVVLFNILGGVLLWVGYTTDDE